MNASITARELFEQQHERLGLRWVAGQEGASRVLESVETVARRPSLAGYLNIIYPNKVQILGTEELAWLDALDARQRWETIEKMIQFRPLAMVISKSQPCQGFLPGLYLMFACRRASLYHRPSYMLSGMPVASGTAGDGAAIAPHSILSKAAEDAGVASQVPVLLSAAAFPNPHSRYGLGARTERRMLVNLAFPCKAGNDSSRGALGSTGTQQRCQSGYGILFSSLGP